jgi:hypothetical protein
MTPKEHIELAEQLVTSPGVQVDRSYRRAELHIQLASAKIGLEAHERRQAVWAAIEPAQS